MASVRTRLLIVNKCQDPERQLSADAEQWFIRRRHGNEYILLVESGQRDITEPVVLSTSSFTQNLPVQGKASSACTVQICTVPAKVYF
jgi:hypothetical protein